MCVIIHCPEGSTGIPHEKLVSACNVNPHGYGLITSDRGILDVRKGLTPKGNDPDEIALLLEQSKGLEVFLHLRYQTSGKRDLANAHPFEVLSREKDGCNIHFMHNGHLNDFTSSPDRCDSWVYAEEIIRPLLLGSIAYAGPEAVLTQPYIAAILKEFAGDGSVFLLVADNNQSLTINEKRGVKYDWGWASNAYSFARESRRDPSPKSATLYQGIQKFPKTATDNWKTEPKDRETFCEIYGIASLKDVCSMSEGDILTLCEDYPDVAGVLILDLLDAVYTQKKSEPNYGIGV
jgi:Glutamine amidotransferases class-II